VCCTKVEGINPPNGGEYSRLVAIDSNLIIINIINGGIININGGIINEGTFGIF